jgi:thioredoxin:protein disulfide reductase
MRKLPLRISFIAIFLTVLSIFPFIANADNPTEPAVPAELVLSHSAVVPGGNITLALIYNVPDDHHVTDKNFGLYYLEPEFPEGISVVETTWPEGEIENDEEVYRGVVIALFQVQVSNDVVTDSYDIPYAYGYQICRELDPEMCFLPNGGDGSLKLNVTSDASSIVASDHKAFGNVASTESSFDAVAEDDGKLENKLASALDKGSVISFILVFLAGVLVSFTPCVYPMIPIIIGFVGGSAGGSKLKGFILSIFFVLGLAIVYAILGVIAGATGALFGGFMSNPIVLWFIVAIFIALGLSMMGMFDITVPAALQGKMMSGKRSGIIGAILIGGVTGIVAAPCAGPPLLILLSWIGNSGNLVLGFFLMATFGLGIGLLFIVIGTFAGAMTALPTAGEWMVKIKKGLGVLIFAVALYYVGLLVPEYLFTMLIGSFIFVSGMFLGAALKWENLGGAAKFYKSIGILLAIAGAFYFIIGLADLNNISLSGGGSAGSSEAVVDENHVAWVVNEHDQMLEAAKSENKPLLIDFYADWCGVCVELDHKVWNQRMVIDATDADYLALKLDFTKADPDIEALRKKYGVSGLPTVMILGPDGKERARFSSFMSPEDVVKWLADNK